MVRPAGYRRGYRRVSLPHADGAATFARRCRAIRPRSPLLMELLSYRLSVTAAAAAAAAGVAAAGGDGAHSYCRPAAGGRWSAALVRWSAGLLVCWSLNPAAAERDNGGPSTAEQASRPPRLPRSSQPGCGGWVHQGVGSMVFWGTEYDPELSTQRVHCGL